MAAAEVDLRFLSHTCRKSLETAVSVVYDNSEVPSSPFPNENEEMIRNDFSTGL